MTNKLHKGLKPARKLLQVSQTELARRIGKNNVYYSGIELGRTNGSIKLYNMVCDALDIPLVVVAMEALQLDEIRGRDMAEFLAIKERLYRFLGVEKVQPRKMDVIEGQKLAKRLWEAKQLKQSMATLDYISPRMKSASPEM